MLDLSGECLRTPTRRWHKPAPFFLRIVDRVGGNAETQLFRSQPEDIHFSQVECGGDTVVEDDPADVE